jgi:nitrate reductase gamma subunit
MFLNKLNHYMMSAGQAILFVFIKLLIFGAMFHYSIGLLLSKHGLIILYPEWVIIAFSLYIAGIIFNSGLSSAIFAVRNISERRATMIKAYELMMKNEDKSGK